MGDLAFNQSFDMLSSSKNHRFISLLSSSQSDNSLFLPPWLSRLILKKIPSAKKTFRAFGKFCGEMMESRMSIQGKQENPDITHFLIEDFNSKSEDKKTLDRAGLSYDSLLVIVAGSDTTASTMAFLIHYLVREEGLLMKLRADIEEHMNEEHGINNRALLGAPLLNACIQETLRLHPATPGGLFRKTPAEGVHVGNTWIPGDTTLLVNFYAIGRGKYSYLEE